jgi:hypothetical protein
MLLSKSCHLVLFLASLLSANAVDPPVELGTAEKYAILTKTGISTVPQSTITGDIAVSPKGGAEITGFSLTLSGDGKSSTSDQVTGTHVAYGADYKGDTPELLRVAILDMEAAYTDAAARSNGNDTSKTNLGAGGIGGLTLTPGVYTFGSGVNVMSDVTFTGDGVFIIQMTGGLTVASDMKVILAGGAQAKNIFWQVAGTISVGNKAHMEGIFLAKGVVAFVTGSSLNGRVFSQTACTLQSTTIVSDTSPAIVRKNLRH